MTVNKYLKVGGIVLAAGGSSRLGRPKQLLEFEGKTLLRWAVEAMRSSVCDPIAAVLGAESEKAEAEIADIDIIICLNREWNLGMSTSIALGLKELLSIEPDLDALVITLCDQPLIDAGSIDRLAANFAETRKQIVAAKYDGVSGVPALFSREMFDSLAMLSGDKGARDLIRDPNASIATIEIKEAAIDIDTPDEMDRLKLLDSQIL